MNTKKSFTFPSAILVGFFVLACCVSCDLAGKKFPDNFSTGAMEGRTYKNDFLKIEFTAPEGWHIADKDTMDAQWGKDESDTATGAFFLKHGPDETEHSNPAFVFMIEMTDFLTNSSEKYAKVYKESLGTTGIKANDTITEKTIGGKTFKVVTAAEMVSYIIVKDECAAILSIYGWGDGTEKTELEAILETVKFE